MCPAAGRWLPAESLTRNCPRPKGAASPASSEGHPCCTVPGGERSLCGDLVTVHIFPLPTPACLPLSRAFPGHFPTNHLHSELPGVTLRGHSPQCHPPHLHRPLAPSPTRIWLLQLPHQRTQESNCGFTPHPHPRPQTLSLHRQHLRMWRSPSLKFPLPRF